jgi:hypothetical protein
MSKSGGTAIQELLDAIGDSVETEFWNAQIRLAARSMCPTKSASLALLPRYTQAK